ncbi:MAG: hypothetical protein ACM3XM_10905 [Mycobacterium leprae]
MKRYLILLLATLLLLTGCNQGSQGPLTPADAQKAIAKRAQEAITAIANKDMAKLSAMAHPEQGIRFSPYAHVRAGQNEDLLFTAAQIKGLMQEPKQYTWGVFDGSGAPIQLTFPLYYDRFIYDLKFAEAPQISYNQPLGKGNTPDNAAEVYPNAIIVEYHFPQVDPQYQGMDWRSLRLVFQQSGRTWYLVGIIHAQWTI